MRGLLRKGMDVLYRANSSIFSIRAMATRGRRCIGAIGMTYKLAGARPHARPSPATTAWEGGLHAGRRASSATTTRHGHAAHGFGEPSKVFCNNTYEIMRAGGVGTEHLPLLPHRAQTSGRDRTSATPVVATSQLSAPVTIKARASTRLLRLARFPAGMDGGPSAHASPWAARRQDALERSPVFTKGYVETTEARSRRRAGRVYDLTSCRLALAMNVETYVTRAGPRGEMHPYAAPAPAGVPRAR